MKADLQCPCFFTINCICFIVMNPGVDKCIHDAEINTNNTSRNCLNPACSIRCTKILHLHTESILLPSILKHPIQPLPTEHQIPTNCFRRIYASLRNCKHCPSLHNGIALLELWRIVPSAHLFA